MKIIHVSPSIARTDGGPSEVLRRLVPSLKALGHDVEVATTDKGMSNADQDLVGADWLHVVPCRFGGSLTFAPAMRPLLLDLAQDADLVHVHGFQSYVGTSALKVASRLGLPTVIEPHGALDAYHWRQNRVRKRVYYFALDRKRVVGAGAIKASSQLEFMEGRVSVPDARWRLGTLGVDEDVFGLDRPSRRSGTILFLGRLARKKRPDLLLRALRVLLDAGHEFRIIFAGPMEDALGYDVRELAAGLGLSDQVAFLGPVDQEAKLRLLSESDVFVLPSEDESFGISVAEALAAGLPVVSTARVGVAAQASAAGASVSVDLDEMSVSRGILEAFERSDELSLQGRTFARNRLTWAAAAKSMEEIYRSVTSSSQSLPQSG